MADFQAGQRKVVAFFQLQRRHEGISRHQLRLAGVFCLDGQIAGVLDDDGAVFEAKAEDLGIVRLARHRAQVVFAVGQRDFSVIADRFVKSLHGLHPDFFDGGVFGKNLPIGADVIFAAISVGGRSDAKLVWRAAIEPFLVRKQFAIGIVKPGLLPLGQ